MNLSRGRAQTSVFDVGASANNNENNFRAALGTPGVYTASGPLTIAECSIKTEHGVLVAHVRDTSISGAGADQRGPCNLANEIEQIFNLHRPPRLPYQYHQPYP